jgi:hypothetical protein
MSLVLILIVPKVWRRSYGLFDEIDEEGPSEHDPQPVSEDAAVE